MSSHPHAQPNGPFRATQLREGDRYELSRGHAIECSPADREHAGTNLTGGAALETDPEVGAGTRQRILSCRERHDLDVWLTRAVGVERAEDIFADDDCPI